MLIKSSLQTMGLHLFASLYHTASLIRDFDKINANYFWGQQDEKHNHHWVSWRKIFLPKIEGGLGLLDSLDVCNTFTCKLWVNLLQNQSLWA